MAIMLLPESFAKEIANVTEDNQYQVADVSRDQVVVRRVFNNRLGKGATSMAAAVSVTLMAQRAELSMLFGYPTSFGW